MKKYLLISVLSAVIILGGCSLKNISLAPQNTPKNNEVAPAVSSTPTGSSETENNQATTSDKNVLVDAKHGVKIIFPTDYVFSQGTSSRIYFGPKITGKVCKNPPGDGCPSGYVEKTVYNYSLDFVPSRSVSAILKDLTFYTGSDGVIYRNPSVAEAPQTEKINGHDVVSHLAEGDGNSSYVMEVVGTKYNYVFQGGVVDTVTATSTFAHYMSAVIKNIEYLK